jgi:hypothetical protein
MTYDSERIKTMMDEAPLIFRIDGSKTRIDLIKIAASFGRKYHSADDIILEADKILKWVNNER